MTKAIYYAQFLGAFFIAQVVSMWGQYFTLKYPNMGMLEAFLRAIPFAWIDWFFMTVAVGIGHKHNLVTPTQDTFLLIIIQFTTILIINAFWLKQPIHTSDIVTFFVILVGFYISFTNAVSKLLGIKIPPKMKPDEDAPHGDPPIKSGRHIVEVPKDK
jgi:hypothetical protein